MQHLLRWSLIGLAVASLAACGGSKQQQASSPYQQQASGSNQQQQASLTPEESAQLEQASKQQEQSNKQLQAEKEKAREWYSSSNTCAARIPEVFLSVQDSVEGAKVIYYTTNIAYIDPLRSNVASLLENGPDQQARASGGTPMSQSGELPPVMIKTTRNPDGITVDFKAKSPEDIDKVRQMVREDAHNQQLGNCSNLRVPDSADIDKD